MSLRVDEFTSLITEKLKNKDLFSYREGGRVLSVQDSVLIIEGLPNVCSMEIIENDSGTKAMVLNLEKDIVKAMVFEENNISAGDIMYRTEKIMEVPVGFFSGRILNSLGVPIDDKGPLDIKDYYKTEKEPTSIINRSPVNRPLETGILAIESLISIGKGQREMILGDKRTGKTSIAISAIINQKRNKLKKLMYCIYVSIGQKNSSVMHLFNKLEREGAMEYTFIVHSSASDKPLMKYLTPYSATAMAEYLKDLGHDVMVVYDDLYQHAIAYRELSLLLRRPPGREAYPGDIFYLHSRLLERSAQDKNGGSISSFPIVEIQGGDISSYIATNIISITDGQIFLSSDLFNEGKRPAIDINLSVSRIGSAAQSAIISEFSKGLKSAMSQYDELKQFSSFLSELDDTTIESLSKGNFFRNIVFVQEESILYSTIQQAALLYAGTIKNFIKLPESQIKNIVCLLLQEIENFLPKSLSNIDLINSSDIKWGEKILEFKEFVNNFIDGIMKKKPDINRL
jgi:F-type H+-transporting ATPase subunit alpha